jgi:hypothetical protein
MAIGVRIKLAGGTAVADIDRRNEAIDPDGNPPAGLLFHASGPIDGGIGVIDFWESPEAFDRFAQDRIGPGMAAAGIEGQRPEIHEFAVHEHFPR